MPRRGYPENLRGQPEIGLICSIYSWYTDFMARSDKALANCTGFEWDHGNIAKNRNQHDVTTGECEQIFFNKPLIVKPDKEHSIFENRYYALGRTNMNRLLFIAFTIRNEKIRIISARDMTDGEIGRYQK
jgi:hypothetical protein